MATEHPLTALHCLTPAGRVALLPQEMAPAGARRLLQGRASLLPDGAAIDLPAEGERDLLELAGRLASLRDQVAARFVAREELAQAVACAIACGEHVFVLSPPGAAKSAFLRAFAEGIGGRFFRVVLNPDIPREAIFGAIDPQALAEGRWRRHWEGLAICHLALLDEVFKASPQVLNMLLDALEERRVSGAGEEVVIPLLSALCASNEAPEEPELRAVYDRLLVRLPVGYVQDPVSFRRLLLADAGATPVAQAMTAEEAALLAAAVEAMASHVPAEVVDALVNIWAEMRDRAISDRRWRRSLKVATAQALLAGKLRPEPRDLSVLRWVLWTDPQEEKEVRDLVLGMTDPLAGRVLDLEALLQDLLRRLESLGPQATAEEKTRLLREARSLREEAFSLLPQAGAHRERVETVAQRAQGIVEQILEGL
jgi:MoxR-like ATPase